MHRTIPLLLVAVLVLLPLYAGAQQSGEKKPNKEPVKEASKDEPKPAGKKAAGKEMPVITPEREAAALTFVREHHPELADLVAVLKEKHPKEYQKAIRDLFRASERLAQVHDLDNGRYELELKAWKLQSRVQLLTARMTMKGGPPADKLREELKTALEQQYDNQLALVKAERERVAQRLETVDKQLKNLEQRRAEAIERQIDVLTHEVKKMKEKPVPASTGK